MNYKLDTNKLIILLIILFTVIIYFLGFYFREISNGAGHTDLQLHIWPLINDFKNNYFDTLENYLSYREATFPFFHTLQSTFNPFVSHYIYFCLSNTIFNFYPNAYRRTVQATWQQNAPFTLHILSMLFNYILSVNIL